MFEPVPTFLISLAVVIVALVVVAVVAMRSEERKPPFDEYDLTGRYVQAVEQVSY